MASNVCNKLIPEVNDALASSDIAKWKIHDEFNFST